MLNTQLYFISWPELRSRIDEPEQSHPAVSISLRAVYFEILRGPRLNYPFRLTHILAINHE